MVSLEQLEPLPLLYCEAITEKYIDPNGHMNMRWYVTLLSEASWAQYDLIGMNAEYFQTGQGGGFTLKIFIQFMAEVNAGEAIAIRSRLLGRSDKRLHYMMFMVNETTGKLACIGEGLDSHADLATRRTSPFPAQIAARIDALVAEHQRLDWDAPVCGAIHV